MLDEMTLLPNASKFAKFLEYEKPYSLSTLDQGIH